MSRVYDALQQCIPEGAFEWTAPESKVDGLFSQQFGDSVWDPESVPVLELSLADAERVPMWSAPGSFASEQFRLLATRLQHLQEARPLKSALLTSSVEGEGKSMLAMNLAISLAQGSQRRVLIVDAELRKPGFSGMLNLGKQKGLKDWYECHRPLPEFVYKLGDLNFWVLPAGQAPVDPMKLLSSPHLPDLHAFLTATFDWVLIDAPPLIPLADAEILSRIADATLLVVRRDKTPKRALKEALDRVAPSKMAGFLLNEFPSAGTYGSTKESGKHVEPAVPQQPLQTA